MIMKTYAFGNVRDQDPHGLSVDLYRIKNNKPYKLGVVVLNGIINRWTQQKEMYKEIRKTIRQREGIRNGEEFRIVNF